MSAPRSNREIGDKQHRLLASYLDRVGDDVPRKPNGDGDIAGIVASAGLSSRQIIYQTQRNRDLLNGTFRRLGIPEIGARDRPSASPDGYDRPGAVAAGEEEKRLRRRNGELERELTVARGEVAELRRRMRRFEAIEIHLADTGRLPR